MGGVHGRNPETHKPKHLQTKIVTETGVQGKIPGTHRLTYIHRDRGSETDSQTYGFTDSQAYRLTDSEAERGTETETETDGQTDIQTDKQSEESREGVQVLTGSNTHRQTQR